MRKEWGAVLALSLPLLASAGEVYTWKDASGRVHFGDQPPGQGANRVEVRAPGVRSSFDAALLAGTWVGRAQKGSVTMVVRMTLGSDHRFTGAAEANGRRIWEYGGDWQLDGDTLHWTYTESSMPLPDAARKDSDRLLSLTAERMEVLSALSGERRVFTRQ